MITLGTALLLQNPDQLAALAAADWDPPAFPEPEKLDLARRAAHHVAFSWGPDQCIGQQPARIELHIAFSTLFRRVPTLRLAVDVSELKFKEDSQAYGHLRAARHLVAPGDPWRSGHDKAVFSSPRRRPPTCCEAGRDDRI
ncbi:cytochrome P450 [Streptomyces mirabilis]|uniref:cytochrome P450 n=1 Tax=Streptomyces mirabilis TaxID=68239 RepID=UPI0036A5B6D7